MPIGHNGGPPLDDLPSEYRWAAAPGDVPERPPGPDRGE